MAKIPKDVLRERGKRKVRSPLDNVSALGRTTIHKNTVTFADGGKLSFPTREAAWKAYKLAKKENGESF